jgi:hypothetical protein
MPSGMEADDTNYFSSRDMTPHTRLIDALRTLWFPQRVSGLLHSADTPPVS